MSNAAGSSPLARGAVFEWLNELQRSISDHSPVRAHIFVMTLLFSTALIVGYVLLPGDSERIAMLERDGKTTEARSILESEFAAGDRRQRTLFLLEGLYEQAGDLSRARAMLELLAKLRPTDTALQKQLGTFYKLTHDEVAYTKSLITQIDLRYAEAACRELIGLFRRKGAYAEEQAALSKCRTKGYRRPDDMVRLASLMAADGDSREAANLLRAVDDLRRLKSDRERLQLFDLLLQNDQPNEAQRRAARWVKGSKDDQFALTVISELVADRRPELAIELARETSAPGDSVFLAIPEVMLELNQTAAAQAMLRGWLDKATFFSSEIAGRFVSAALGALDPVLAYSGAQKAGLATVPVRNLEDLARALTNAGMAAEAQAVRVFAPAKIDVATASGSPVDEPTAGPIRPFVTLEGWRAALWKRLRDTNRGTGISTLGARGFHSNRALQAIQRARKLRSAGRQPSARNKPQPPSQYFSFPVLP